MMNIYEFVQNMKNPQTEFETNLEFVVHTGFDGFDLSEEAYLFLGLDKDEDCGIFNDNRSNPDLISCVKSLGDDAGSSLEILSINVGDIEDAMFTVSYNSESIIEKYDSWSDNDIPLLEIL